MILSFSECLTRIALAISFRHDPSAEAREIIVYDMIDSSLSPELSFLPLFLAEAGAFFCDFVIFAVGGINILV